MERQWVHGYGGSAAEVGENPVSPPSTTPNSNLISIPSPSRNSNPNRQNGKRVQMVGEWASGDRVAVRASPSSWLQGVIRRLSRGGVRVWIAQAQMLVHVPAELIPTHLLKLPSPSSSLPTAPTQSILHVPTTQPGRFRIISIRPAHLAHRLLFHQLQTDDDYAEEEKSCPSCGNRISLGGGLLCPNCSSSNNYQPAEDFPAQINPPIDPIFQPVGDLTPSPSSIPLEISHVVEQDQTQHTSLSPSPTCTSLADRMKKLQLLPSDHQSSSNSSASSPHQETRPESWLTVIQNGFDVRSTHRQQEEMETIVKAKEMKFDRENQPHNS